MKKFIAFFVLFFIASSAAFALDQKIIGGFTKEKGISTKEVQTTLDALQDPKKLKELVSTLKSLSAADKSTSESSDLSGATKTFEHFSDQLISYFKSMGNVWDELVKSFLNISLPKVHQNLIDVSIFILAFAVLSFSIEYFLRLLRERILHRLFSSEYQKTIMVFWDFISVAISVIATVNILLAIAKIYGHSTPFMNESAQIFAYYRYLFAIASFVYHGIFNEIEADDRHHLVSRLRSFVFYLIATSVCMFFLKVMQMKSSELALLKETLHVLAAIWIIALVFDFSTLLKSDKIQKKMKQVLLQTPTYLKPLIKFLLHNFHFIIIISSLFWLYYRTTPFEDLQLNMYSFFGCAVIVITWSIGRTYLGHFATYLEKQHRSRGAVMVALAESRGTILFALRFTWHFLTVLAILHALGIGVVAFLSSNQVYPYVRKLLAIALILLVMRSLWLVINYVIQLHLKPQKIDGKKREPTQFAKTMAPVFRSLSHWGILIVTVLLILEESGIPVLPIFYGMGFFAFAISMGSQSLIKDFINGFFTLMEGNIAVGEYVTIGSNTGLVESLSLRGVVLRHGSGALQTIPFSEVTSITNRSRDYTTVMFDIPIALNADLKTVDSVLQSAYNDMVNDPIFGTMILGPLNISGVDKMTDTAAHVTASIKTQPDPRNYFFKAFNRYLKDRIVAANVFPEPTVVKLLPAP